MKTTVVYLVILCLIVSCTNGETKHVRKINSDGSEAWGYVEVRPKAHMFWWHYKSPYRVENPSKPWPIILWLQGGPGASGVGIGNFQEVGPLDTFLKPRNSTWLKKADLLFVDSPVGAGYSFVEGNQKDLYVKSDEEAAQDLTKLLQQLFNKNQTLNQSPLFIVAESYGGKIAVKLGLSVIDAVQSGKLKLHLGGVILGDSWISPEDFVFSWGPLLKHVSRLDDNGLDSSNSLAEKIKTQIKNGEYVGATQTWMDLENLISSKSNFVDFYNFLLDTGMDPVSLTTSLKIKKEEKIKKYSRYLNDMRSLSDVEDVEGDLDKLMNGVIKKKLKIIPNDLIWGNNSDDVFTAMEAAFMKPVIEDVDELLATGVDVTIYNGQLDVICSTSGTEAWVHKLRWEGLEEFKKMEREPLFCESDRATRGFTKSYKNLHFYWILGAGHFVPVDEPCVALKMVGEITKSPQL
ncbi:serine carboxypeptidase-like 51 [Arabidopsis thaliana]|jgi:serine carboxypeptidase 1|uniref:Serine carboxypeptidase-like 51 n=1 Tax=Arabidopsis thaliana TaxID=3702 RepID=SCP51_ARATH|nr:serine carboxypeptidase-like 51 [Arabidopsis thaliana]Q67Y83.2 RecName: Full=Serine carboxypeptidase-like 51; Flags: Precursor [Arabidopsis thaliana]AAD21510.2 putative carboxypeptidase [Arabidopsis thaliana]AAL06502.1 At2g27920/T1E2.16 [Arabidopsis thaliana]AAO23606.1 At2g27920/T1E2.16 [Arabidopsis thaliana]AEC08059.1 serine carboxypeptidase-like 51 [Arabidopsis thaliana]|eukprot:NP_565663.1 serine carboxypeptidase-like 51 [Arabidopsis thaliana]